MSIIVNNTGVFKEGYQYTFFSLIGIVQTAENSV